MIVFVGQVGSDFADREAFQEIDYRRMYGSSVKWVAQIDRADRIPEYVARAFRVATIGPARVRWCWRCRRTCSSPAQPSTTPPASSRRSCTRDPKPSRHCAHSSSRRAGRWCSSAAAAGTSAPAPTSRALSRPTPCRSRARSATRTSSTTATSTTRARSASDRTPSLPRACAMRTCCWSSASVSASR